MGKGKRSSAAIVISSSDNDEEEDLLLKSNLRNSKLKSNSKSKSASVPRTNPNKRAKKAPLSSSLPRHSKNHSGFDEIKKFCEEFDMGFNDFKVMVAALTCGLINTSLVLWKRLLFTRRRLKRSKHGLRRD